MRTIQRAIPAFLAAAAGALAGCGYSTAPMHPTDVKTVCVEMFNRGSNVYRRGLEFELTEALVKRIELDTRYKVTKKGRADTLLTGTLDQVEQRVLSFNPDTGLPRELAVTYYVSFTWTDLRQPGKVRTERTNMRVESTYIPPEPFNEEFFQGSQDVANRVAKRIVEEMESRW